jgi:hypothetical protein
MQMDLGAMSSEEIRLHFDRMHAESKATEQASRQKVKALRREIDTALHGHKQEL